MSGISLIDAMVILGVAVVLPLSLGGGLARWAMAGGAVFVSLLLPTGGAALFALPFLGVAIAALVEVFRDIGLFVFFWKTPDVVRLVATAYAVVAAAALLQSRAGLALFGVHEPIVELTAVHYVFAGCAALVLAGAALERTDGRWRRAGATAVACTAVAPVVIAFGFVSGFAVPQVGGAVLMTSGVWLTATLELRAAERVGWSLRAVLLATSGLAVWVPMVLAVAWASGQHWDVPALSIPDMARTHGLANAVAFIGCGLVARQLRDEVAT